MVTRSLIADGHELFRAGLKTLVLSVIRDAEVLEAPTLENALDLLEQNKVDLVLIALRMPNMCGAETLAALRDAYPEAKIVVVSASEEHEDIIASFDAGVHGYIPKSLPSPEIADAIRSVIEGHIFAPSAIACRADQHDLPRSQAKLRVTPRQREVLNELMRGRSSKEIARALGITQGTVKIHLAAIYRTLGVRSRAEVIARFQAVALAR